MVQVKDHYYNTKEYHALMPEQKSELCHKCKICGHKSGDKSSKKAKPDELAKGIATMSHTIAQTIVTALAAKEKTRWSVSMMTRPTLTMTVALVRATLDAPRPLPIRSDA